MTATTAVATLAITSMIRGGARAPPPPPPKPEIGFDLQEPYEAFMRINEPTRFFVSGNVGNVAFYFIERLVAFCLTKFVDLPPTLKDYEDSLSFFIGYLIQIVSQHWLHAFLVYGLDTIDTREKYIRTLLGQFSAYLGSLIGSTMLNTFFIKTLELNKTVAFIVTLWTFACINYFLIGWIVRKGQETPNAAKAPKSGTPEARKKAADLKKQQEEAARKKAADAKKKAQAAKRKADEQAKKKAAEARKRDLEAKKKKEEQQKKKKQQQSASAKKVAKKPRGGAQSLLLLPSSLCQEEASLLHSFVVSVSNSVTVE